MSTTGEVTVFRRILLRLRVRPCWIKNVRWHVGGESTLLVNYELRRWWWATDEDEAVCVAMFYTEIREQIGCRPGELRFTLTKEDVL